MVLLIKVLKNYTNNLNINFKFVVYNIQTIKIFIKFQHAKTKITIINHILYCTY